MACTSYDSFSDDPTAMTSGNPWYVIVDDQSPQIQYEGRWFNEVASNAFNSSLSLTTTAGSSAIFNFHGTFPT